MIWIQWESLLKAVAGFIGFQSHLIRTEDMGETEGLLTDAEERQEEF